MSFTAKAGETTAIVGKSGSGKSTLFSLIIGAYPPDQGKVLLGGIPLEDIDTGTFLKHVGYVPQVITVFSKSILYNCRLANAEATEEEIMEAAEQVGLADFIRSLPKGLRSKIGEGGAKLCGGERQRVALMMALLRRPTLFLLDEATSSLDNETEGKIKETVRRCIRDNNATAIIIAHRLTTIIHADKIVVMDEGQVAGIGTHEELLETCPAYQRLNSDSLVFG